MNIVSSAVSRTVADPPASSRFFTSHLGCREILAGEEFVALGRNDGARYFHPTPEAIAEVTSLLGPGHLS
ncbi:hypothetical protein [Nonomuraea dietziae]|uniref:hypothetical protein n=1 Tax=Nonomuraea dietziae TaxID=65515 RepID=UPI0033C5B6FE